MGEKGSKKDKEKAQKQKQAQIEKKKEQQQNKLPAKKPWSYRKLHTSLRPEFTEAKLDWRF